MATPHEIQSTLDAYVARLPGAAVVIGVVDQGNVTTYTAGSLGPGKAKVDAQTLFQIGSITKTFTATLLASMVERGEVRLDDPIQTYLLPGARAPSYDGNAITLLNLAEQNSGLPRLPTNLDLTAADPYAAYTPSMLATFLSSYTLTRAPGAAYEYSNLGVGLLGDLLAHRAGTTYDALLQRRILQPLAMTSTTATPDAQALQHLAPGFSSLGKPVAPWAFGELGAAGALYSNLHDMLRYLQANLAAPQGALGKAMAMAQQPRADDDSRGISRVGLVWLSNSGGNRFMNGETGGYHALIAFNHDRQAGIVVLANVADEGVDAVGLHAFAPDIVPAPEAPGTPPAPAPGEVPAVTARAQDWFHRLQTNTVDMSRLTPNFAARITPQILAGIAAGLKDQGDPTAWIYLGSETQLGVTTSNYYIVLDGRAHVWSISLTANGFLAGSELK